MGYFFGVIQKNISYNISDNENNPKIGEPNHLIDAIIKSKNYKKMIEEQEKSKSECKKIIKSHNSLTNKKMQIGGGLNIPEFEPIENISNDDSSFKYMSNHNDKKVNSLNNSENENENKNNKISVKNEINNIQNNENNSNKNIIIIQKNESLATSSKKNSKDYNNNNIINNVNEYKNSQNINNNNNNLYILKNSPETLDKSEDKLYENDKKQRKKSSFISEKELDAKDKLKNLKIEINTQKLEDQIRQLFLEKKH